MIHVKGSECTESIVNANHFSSFPSPVSEQTRLYLVLKPLPRPAPPAPVEYSRNSLIVRIRIINLFECKSLIFLFKVEELQCFFPDKPSKPQTRILSFSVVSELCINDLKRNGPGAKSFLAFT